MEDTKCWHCGGDKYMCNCGEEKTSILGWIVIAIGAICIGFLVYCKIFL